jgi:hypothetical protein
MRRLLFGLLITDLILGVLIFLFLDFKSFLSFEVAFASSAFVILVSFESYKRAVLKSLEQMETSSNPDEIDKIEDPFDLYEEEENKASLDPKKLLEEEKQRVKSLKNLKESIKESKNFFSFPKIISYGVLAIGFIFLEKEGYLTIFVYLISLAIPIIVTVWLLLNQELKDVSKT